MVTEPFYRRDKITGHLAFMHPCRVCGSEIAPFGFGVSLLKNKPGRWYCGEHKDEDNGQAEQSGATGRIGAGIENAPAGLPELDEARTVGQGDSGAPRSLFD